MNEWVAHTAKIKKTTAKKLSTYIKVEKKRTGKKPTKYNITDEAILKFIKGE